MSSKLIASIETKKGSKIFLSLSLSEIASLTALRGSKLTGTAPVDEDEITSIKIHSSSLGLSTFEHKPNYYTSLENFLYLKNLALLLV